MTVQELVTEFQVAFQQEPDVEMQVGLIREEFVEVFESLAEEDPYGTAKEIADLLYVTYGLAAMMGIDADRVVRDVHESNMSKLDSNGDPIYRHDGKVLKGVNYMPPMPSREWFLDNQKPTQ